MNQSLFWNQERQHLRLSLRAIAKAHHIQLASAAEEQLIAALNTQVSHLTEKVALITFYKNPQAYSSFTDFYDSVFTLAETEELYPLLKEQIQKLLKIAETSFTRLSQHLQADRIGLSRNLGIPLQDNIAISALTPSLGDPHLGLLGTLFLEINRQGVFYKFRDLNTDRLISKIIALFDWPLVMPITVYGKDHGWQESIHHEYAQSQAEIDSFYYQMGLWLALIFSLKGTDLHFENILAQGAKAYFIDFETLTHPAHPYNDWCEHHHLLHTMILPHISFSTGKKAGADLSALGYIGQIYWPEAQANLVGQDTQSPHYEEEYCLLSPKANLPCASLDERHWQAAEIKVIEGFQRGIADIVSQRKRLIDLLEAESDVSIRILLRPTQTYKKLIFNSNHPDLLQQTEKRMEYFKQICKSRFGRTLPEAIVNSEIQAMALGQVPYFNTTLRSCSLFSGAQLLQDHFFPFSALQQIQSRLSELNEKCLMQCSQLITSAFECARMNRIKPHG